METSVNQPTGHIDSHYSSAFDTSPEFSTLSGQVSTQSCIIGGGLAGVTCARELAREGHDTVLLEANRIGWAASGRNGGFVSDGFAEGISNIIKHVGLEKAKRLHELSQEGVDYMRKAIEELEQPQIIQGHKGLNLIRHGTGETLKNSAAIYRDVLGIERKFLDKQEVQALVCSPKYQAGLLNENAFHIQPLEYAHHLAMDTESRGAKMFEQSPAVRLEKTGSSWKVETPSGSVTADNVVLCTSAYGGIFAPLERALVPVSTYVISTKPLGALLDGVINFDGTISDTRRAGDYYRIIGTGDDRRLIWGGRITTRQSVPKKLEHLMKQDIVQIFPQLSKLVVERAWAGKMGYTRHKMPLIGQLWENTAPKLWACTGFGGHGLNTTAMGGGLIAQAIVKNNERWRAFEEYPPKWTGGTFGRSAVQLSYLTMQIRDFFDEKTVR